MYDGLWFCEPGAQLSTASCYAVASPSATSCLSSPSSGYSSADEGRATPVGESGWVSPTVCLLSSDPYLTMTPTNAVSRRPADAATMPSSWSGASLVLDDFIDTIWDSLTSGVDASVRPPDSGGWSAETEMLAGRQTTQCPTTMTTVYNYSDPITGCNGTFGDSRLAMDVDGRLQTSVSGALFVVPPLLVGGRANLDASAPARRRLSDSGFRQHAAGLMSGMATGDVDYCLLRHGGRIVTDMPPPASPQVGTSAGRVLGGVLGQRSGSKSMLNAAASSSSRVRGAVLAKSCGDALLQRAAVGLSKSAAAGPTRSTAAVAGRSPASAAFAAKSRGSPASSRGSPASSRGSPASGLQQSSARVAGIRSSLSSSRLSDAGRVPAYLALDDHRYTLRVPPPPNPHTPPSKIQKTRSRSSGMRQSASSGSLVGITSILEAFLRTTRPMDPNQGSNAALAAAGLAHLPLSGNQTAVTPAAAADHGVDDDASGTLLKKLLTGEIDQNDVQTSFPAGTTTTPTTEAIFVNATDTVTSMDTLLAEGFGFEGDLCLDDPQSMSLSLLDDVADDGLWITAHTDDLYDKLMSSELDEILREQNRRDDLCLQHYVTELL